MTDRSPHKIGQENSGADDDQEAGRKAAWRELLGVVPPPRLDDALAPPIDATAERLLRAYFLNELSGEQKKMICDLTLAYRSWSDALMRVGAEGFSKRQASRD